MGKSHRLTSFEAINGTQWRQRKQRHTSGVFVVDDVTVTLIDARAINTDRVLVARQHGVTSAATDVTSDDGATYNNNITANFRTKNAKFGYINTKMWFNLLAFIALNSSLVQTKNIVTAAHQIFENT